ncbi:MAG: DUF4091 domain-containing protein [Acidobacteriota bacterium]
MSAIKIVWMVILLWGLCDAMPVYPQGSQQAVAIWLESSLQRVFPSTQPTSSAQLNLLTARNAQVSFQACVRNQTSKAVKVTCMVEGSRELDVQIRRVGYVPVPHHTTEVELSELDGVGHIPGLVPDPLFPEGSTTVGPFETQSFWVTVKVPLEAETGVEELGLVISDEQKQVGRLAVQLKVSSLQLRPRQGLPVTHWWHPDAIYDWYKVEPFSDAWWWIVEPYIRNMVSHGSNVVFVPIFYMRREIVERPPQLLKVRTPAPGKYEFDFSDVRRFVKLAERCGAQYFEWTHLWVYWGVRNPIRVYRQEGKRWSLLWDPDTDATSPTYRNFLEQFLPQFHRFLEDEKLLDRSFFHLSDEPHGDEHFANYRKARALLRELAPWMKVMDALSEVRYGQAGLTDIPVPLLSSAQDYIDAGIPHWVYFCTAPRGAYLNRLLDTPLAKIRMSGWLFFKLGAQGFLHWGYSYWYRMETQELIDPFTETTSGVWPGIPPGDPFVVYPGKNGPLDSIRWEVFAESLQDYALLETAGIDPDSPVLAEIKSYSDFPKNETWLRETIRGILENP